MRCSTLTLAFCLCLLPILGGDAFAEEKKPNILVILGDDIGVHNISTYNHGIMGYETPDIDRIAKEGAFFTDFYAQQSCTAGRASFILGEHPFRTGLLTIGMPGSDHGIPDRAPTIADLLKEQGYTSGQFGENHLGDRDKHLPTAHGFDEFFGNLYHLNAEEEPEFRKKFGPREAIYYFGQGGELNAVRFQDWKVHFAKIQGNIATGERRITNWPLIINLRAAPCEKTGRESEMYFRWYADNMWLFVPVQAQIKKSLSSLEGFPMQQGSSLNAAGINYGTLKAKAALKRLQGLENIYPPVGR